LGFNYIYQYNLIYLIINFNLIKQNKGIFGPGCGNLAENMAIKVLSLFSTKGGDMANPEMPVAQKRSFLGSLPAAIWLLSAAIMAMRIAEVFYVPILPLYVKALDTAAPLFLVGIVTGIHRLSLAFTQPLAGGWLDRAGRKKPFIIGTGIAAVSSLLGGAAFGPADLVLYRVFSGVGFGLLTLAALAFITDITSSNNRATAMGIFSASTLAGAAIGPLPGGMIAESFSSHLLGYRATFYFSGTFMILVGLYAYFLIKERTTIPAGMTPISKKVPIREVLKNKDIAMASLTTFLWGISYGALLFLTIPLLGEKLGFPPTKIGWVISAFGWGHVAGAFVFGPLSDKFGKRKPFGLISIFGSGVLVILFALSENIWWMVGINALFGFISGPCCNVFPAMMSELNPSAPATSIGAQRFGEQFGIFLGPVIGGLLIPVFGYQGAIMAYGAIMIIGSLVFQIGVAEPRQPIVQL
jgi:MFS family permease